LRRRQEDIPTVESEPSTHQQFEVLPQAPPLPIIDIAREFMAEQQNIDNVTYIASVLESSNATNIPDETSTNGTSLLKRGYVKAEVVDSTKMSSVRRSPLEKRQQKRQCDSSTPCPDGSCCRRDGRCGYGKENCDSSVCISNCGATALCGRDSKGGTVKCPLNVCCSYFGYCGVEQDYCNGGGPTSPCQTGFGSCQTIAPPSCGGNSAAGRSIGYYQLANVRERQCNRIRPKDINIKGLTHLYAAFATINPSTFEVAAADPDDINLYKELTALKSSTLQLWIAIGGWNFNDPGATRTTFSDISRTAARRARFITSLKSFLTTHGFQGVDLDWE
jgi:chitinase